jgi:ribose/xylose/arabinose/galactoside ABC-type transport system permease subunit
VTLIGSRERALVAAIGVLAVVMAMLAPGFYSATNLVDLWLGRLPVLIVALGATLIVVSGEIDVSVGSMFAIVSVVAGLSSKAGLPLAAVGAVAVLAGAALGAVNGALVAFFRIPSIVVTLAMMIGLRDGLRWATQGEWVQNLPDRFQWLGFSQSTYPIATGLLAGALLLTLAWAARSVAAGRAIYAVGSNANAARLAGLNVARVKCWTFVLGGALTGVAALLNSARFNQIPSNSGLGLEMTVIASVIVGGAAVTGGRATFSGTVLGVVLLGAIGPALTFLGVSAYWERAIQGAIILAAVRAYV